MVEFFAGNLPDVLYHGSLEPLEPDAVCLPAAGQHWWNLMDWDDYDEGLDGEDRTAYANIAWEYLGLRDEARTDVPEWARDLKDVAELGRRVGILFVTDDPGIAESRYGHVHGIDMTSPDILEAIPDPNPGTYSAWMLLVRAGAPLPVVRIPETLPSMS